MSHLIQSAHCGELEIGPHLPQGHVFNFLGERTNPLPSTTLGPDPITLNMGLNLTLRPNTDLRQQREQSLHDHQDFDPSHSPCPASFTSPVVFSWSLIFVLRTAQTTSTPASHGSYSPLIAASIPMIIHYSLAVDLKIHKSLRGKHLREHRLMKRKQERWLE